MCFDCRGVILCFLDFSRLRVNGFSVEYGLDFVEWVIKWLFVMFFSRVFVMMDWVEFLV